MKFFPEENFPDVGGCLGGSAKILGGGGHFTPPPPSDALEGKGPQRRSQKQLDRRLEDIAKAVGGGYCRLPMPMKLARAVRETVAGHRLRTLEGGGGCSPFQCIPAPPKKITKQRPDGDGGVVRDTSTCIPPNAPTMPEIPDLRGSCLRAVMLAPWGVPHLRVVSRAA